MKIAIRTDASLLIGSGHVMRCKTLADELRKNGADILFICRDHQGNLVSLLTDDDYSVTILPTPDSLNVVAADKSNEYSTWLGVDKSVDALQTIGALEDFKPDWLVVDHYGLDENWEKKLRKHAGKIFVIDDLTDHPHECDVLLNQNLLDNLDNAYQGLVPCHCRKLLGPRFALLRPEFRKARETLRERDGTIRRILVFFGGVDPTGETIKALEAIEMLARPDIVVDVVVGSNNPRVKEIEAICRTMSNVNFHHQISNMAQLMAVADLAIGASGTASWERCTLGLPSISLSIAENQSSIGSALAIRGATFFLGQASHVTSSMLLAAIHKFFADPGLGKLMSSTAMGILDSKSTHRVRAAFGGSLKLSIISDANSWINAFIPPLSQVWASNGHQVTWVKDHELLSEGDCAFFLGYGSIVPDEILRQHVHNLVVHESDLPRGRGWSPLTWQILEGKNEIPIVLFESEKNVDSGVIYFSDVMHFEGHELIDEMRCVQAHKTFSLCNQFVDNYPQVVMKGRAQEGTPSYYRRRSFEDSELEINKSLKDQFSLLRVVDNDYYPAYFVINGHRYVLSIKKSGIVGEEL